PSPAGSRTLEVKILPVADGVTLLWHDVTERTQAEQALKRREDRITLAAEGASDGLWEWDLRTHQFYASGRWRAMVGLPATESLGGPEEWTHRVHPDGIASLGAGRQPARLAGSLTRLVEVAARPGAAEPVGIAGTLDPLTGLCNRAVFVERLGRRLDIIKARPASSRFAVLYLDLDRFKIVNDSLGHMVGDELLTVVSRRLETCLRQGD